MGGAGVEPIFVEDVMSTYLYTGNGSTQTITNGIDLAGEGGLVWTKWRSGTPGNSEHALYDTARGINKVLMSNATFAENTFAGYGVNSFLSTGYEIVDNAAGGFRVNGSNITYASWTFRKQPKFFDVVTYTGNGANRTIAHSLGSVPGCIMVKRTDTTADWQVYHRSNANTQYMVLNSTAAVATGATRWNSTTPTDTVFSLGTDVTVNASGGTYVAYIYAHDAGGFGLTGTDNVISCGSYTVGATPPATITLGYEPQFVMVKGVSGSFPTGSWFMVDSMRGFVNNDGTQNSTFLAANSAAAESANAVGVWPTATGFQASIAPSTTFIYIAIRRGPMKVPTDGTKVFQPVARTGTGSNASITGVSFPPDSIITKIRNLNGTFNMWVDKLRGSPQYLRSEVTNAEVTDNLGVTSFNMDGVSLGTSGNWNGLQDYANWFFRRAPGFFDEVCYTGTGANKTEAHSLQKAPELWLVKSRSATTEWVFGSSLLGANEKIVMPSPNGRVTDTTVWNNTYPTASVLSLGTSSTTNASGATFVAYLWATVSGVSKVGTYTGNGASQTIDCGFAGGARFVMILRATASTAQDIYVWDTARGIVAGNDPRLSLNTTAAEVTTLDTIDTASSGFVVNTDASNVNVNGAVYLYLSIA
jgi:hypothetical protein